MTTSPPRLCLAHSACPLWLPYRHHHRMKQAAEAKALVKPRTRGGSSLYNPSWYDPSHAHTSAPGSTLELEYVHGYAGEMPVGSGRIAVPDREQARRAESTRHAATRSTNVFWLHTGELMFPASAVVVIHESATNRQRFFTGHDEVWMGSISRACLASVNIVSTKLP